jgi:hypothetical protein
MKPRTYRGLAAGLAIALAATGLGCGLVDQAKDIVANASALSDFVERLNSAAQLTYTADYKVVDGKPVTLVQQPPNAAYLSGEGRYILTPDALYLCSKDGGKTRCQRSPNSGVDGADSAGMMAAFAGPGFVSTPIVLAIMTAAIVVPDAKIEQSNKTIAGQDSLCATATGLDSVAEAGDGDAPKEFSVCVTEAGVLASYHGVSVDGTELGVERTKFSDQADPKAFLPPKGATIVDVGQLDPPK